MADRIQLRRDTAANWTNYNPILLEGEPGIELDTDQWKLGDGIHTWSQLAYRGGEVVQQTGQSTTVAMSQKAVTDELNKIDSKAVISMNDDSQANLNIGDPQGNVIAEFKDGHIRTKEFDSRNAFDKNDIEQEAGQSETKVLSQKFVSDKFNKINSETAIVVNDDSQANLNIGDEEGNVIVEFKGGHIRTKEFDSRNSGGGGNVSSVEDDSQANLNIGDPQGNVIAEFKDGHIRTKNFDSRNAAKSYPMDMTSAYKSAADTLIAKVKTLQSAIDKQCVTFALCTDIHYNGTQAEFVRMLNVMEYICSQVNIKFVGNLGDSTTNNDSAYASLYAELIKHSYAYAMVPGNHDSYKPSVQRRTMTQMSDAHFAPKSAACYIDDHLHSVRFICLNTHEKGSDLAGNTAITNYGWSGFGYGQFNWLANEALKTTYKVVLLSHTGFIKTTNDWSCTPHSNYTKVKTLIDAFVDGTSGTIQLTLESDEADAKTSINYDFSNQGAGKIVLFHGHIHGDFPLNDAENTYSKWLEVWVDNALCDNTNYEGHDNVKTANTPTEIAFDIVTIDCTNNMIYCHRFGAGADRTLTFI